jgi:CheY-like chemotaxis protein/HPt (histidine-containing phosphotransfer) domain-containing protein
MAMDNLLSGQDYDRPKVLLVDDDATSLMLFEVFLHNHCDIDVASNGADALEKMKSSCYEMVFMDILMPQMDGLTTIKKFREWERYNQNKQTPIAVVTAKAFSEDKKASYSAGCDIFMTKPINKKTLLGSLYEFTNSEVHSTNLESVAFEKYELNTLDSQDDIVANHDYLSKIVKVLGREKFFSLIDTFSSSGKSMLADLAQQNLSNDKNGIQATSHRMKGMAKHLGFCELAELAEQVQKNAMQGNTDKATSLIHATRDAIPFMR